MAVAAAGGPALAQATIPLPPAPREAATPPVLPPSPPESAAPPALPPSPPAAAAPPARPPTPPAAATPPLLAPAPPTRETVILQGLDKVTARISTFEVPLGRDVRFGTLSIVVRACHKTPPTEPPESAAFIQINELGDDASERLFSGWMFASSPALSALEHPVYDIWVLECKNAANASAENSG